MRTCGECGVCCDRPEVEGPGFHKPAHTPCQHLASGGENRCKVFGTEARPPVCGQFKCSWLYGFGLDSDRPDKSGVLCSLSEMNGGTWVFVLEDKPGALKTTGKGMVEALAKSHEVPVIVLKYDSKPPHDYGDVVVVKDSLKHRATKMIGRLRGFLDEDMTLGIYDLVGV